MSRLNRLLPIAFLSLACAAATLRWRSPAAAAEDPVSWDFVVTIPDLSQGIAHVDWTLRGLSGQTQVCTDMDGAEDYVDGLWQVFPQDAGRGRERPLSRGSQCWPVTAPAAGPLHLRYDYDLGKEADETGNPDYASRIGGDYVLNDGAFLLRPDPIPPHATITVEFRLPLGVSIVTPWQRLPGPGWRFRYDSEQHSAGNYLALGKVASLGELAVGHGTVALAVLDRPRRASDDDLRRWVQRPAEEVAKFYGDLPGQRVLVILVPAQGDDDPGVFGTVLHRRLPSVVLYFGALAPGNSFAGDWVAQHELFHLGNPLVQRRMPWLIEGFTTYYQDVLRGRSGSRPAAQMWDDIYDGAQRYCNSPDGTSLDEDSRHLGQRHNYTRVYWGGACVALLADVAIRQHTANRSSLDDVMRSLWHAGQQHSLSEAEIVAALDRAAGRKVVGEQLYTKKKVDLDGLFRQLGIVPAGHDSVRLLDDAPLAGIRKGIF